MRGTASERNCKREELQERGASSPRRGAGSAVDVKEECTRFDAQKEARYNRATPILGSRGLRRWPILGRHTTPSHRANRARAPRLAGRHRLSVASGEALSTIGRNGSVDDGSAVDAFPGVENEKEIREPFQHHHAFALRTFHVFLLGGDVHS